MSCLARAFPLLLLPALVGQANVVQTSFGVTTHEGVVRGLGPDYSARFEANGVTFTPLLSKRVAAPATLRFTLTSVLRGGAIVFARTRDIAPVATDNQVRYLHDANVVETYDVRQDGIEQNFVFAQRPAGAGDLVVCGEITTDLPLAKADNDGAHFELAGAGGVAFGAVTGVDANGARMRGSLRCSGHHLELSLPASFVDSAAYPLVLDPLIGSSFLIANVVGVEDVKPSLAYDASTQRYLLVWNADVSTTVAEVRAQFVSGTGPIGLPFLLDATADAGVRPTVANINFRNRFVVAWADSSQVEVQTVDAASGGIAGFVAWNAGGAVKGLALGGDSRTLGTADRAMLVLTTETVSSSSCFRMPVQVLANGSLAPGLATTTWTGASRIGAPAITKHAGNHGRWMYTFGTRGLSAPNPAALHCHIVSVADSLCASQNIPIVAGSSDAMHAAVATLDGISFLLAYESASSIQFRRVTNPSSCGTGPMAMSSPFDVPTIGSNYYPELDCARDKWLLAWRKIPLGLPSDVYVMGVGLQSGQGAATLVANSSSAQIDPAVASKWSGGDAASDEALVTWANAGIRGSRWQATGTGAVTSLGGACGITGLTDYASYSGTPVIGTTFTLSLVAPTAPVLALIVGVSSTPFACGPCTVVPSPDVLVASSGPVPVNVPFDANLIGFELFTQWLQWRPSGCPILPDFGFSNTLKFTIAE